MMPVRLASFVGNSNAAEAPRRHDDEHLLHEIGFGGERKFVAGMHEIRDPDKRTAEGAARMEFAILIGGETAPLHQRHRERIAQHQHQGGGGRGSETHRAGFARFRQHQLTSAACISEESGLAAMPISGMWKRLA